jgi:replicative DNA helicase
MTKNKNEINALVYGKLPPQAVEVEEAILGAIMLERDAYDSVKDILADDCFYEHKNQIVWDAIRSLRASGSVIDILTVKSELERTGKIDEVGGAYRLIQLTETVVSAAHITAHAALVRQKHMEREIIRTCGETISRVYNGETDVFEVIDQLRYELVKASEVRTVNDWLHISQVTMKLTEHMDRMKGKVLAGLPTSVSALDVTNGGFRPKQLIIIAARPAVGKSAFAGSIALEIGKAGKVVGFISLEMDDKDINSRMIAAEGRISNRKIDRNNFDSEAEYEAFCNTMATVANLPIFFSDNAQVNISDIRNKAVRLKKKHGLDILIIDYLQLIEPSKQKGKNREQEVSEMSRGLKLLAKELDIPIIVLAQLNRAAMDASNKRPQLHHLRESGSLEQDADVVMFLHREWVYLDESSKQANPHLEREAELLVRKWRNGVGTIDYKLDFTPSQMRFSYSEPVQIIMPKNTREEGMPF